MLTGVSFIFCPLSHLFVPKGFFLTKSFVCVFLFLALWDFQPISSNDHSHTRILSHSKFLQGENAALLELRNFTCLFVLQKLHTMLEKYQHYYALL